MAVVAIATLTSFSNTSAQTIKSVVVNKSITYSQTGTANVQIDPTPVGPNYGGPYGFGSDVWGTNLQSINPPRVFGPITVASNFYSNGYLFYSTDDGGWRMGPNANDWGSPTLSHLNARFGDGIYSFLISGNTLNLNLNGRTYPNAPLVGLTGGAWIGSTYVIDSTSSLTITSNTFSAYGTHPIDIISIGVEGVGGIYQLSTVNPSAKFLQYTLPANTLSAGQSYIVDTQFDAGVDLQSVNWLPGSINYASYASVTRFTISAVPDVNSGILLSAGFGMILFARRKRGRQAH